MFEKFFEGRACFTVQECDYHIINRLRIYKLRNIEIGDNLFRFTVPLRNVEQVKNVLTRQKFSYEINKTILTFLNTFYTRIALTVSAIVCLIAFIVMNNFIFSVKIIGIDGEQQQQITQYIRAQNIKPLTFKSSEKATDVAESIMQNFDFVAHASSKIVGNTLIFNIYSVSIAGDKNNNNDIIASADGVVTSIVVASGRGMVKAGDVVRKGDILIKGEYQTGENEFSPCRAVGEVKADIKYSEYTVLFNTTQIMTADGQSAIREIDLNTHKHVIAAELLEKIKLKTGISEFDKIENFFNVLSPESIAVEVVATINVSIVK